MKMAKQKFHKSIMKLIEKYYSVAFAPTEFIPGKTPVSVAGRVFNALELQYLVDASLEFWLTSGRYAKRFEQEFASFFGMKHAVLVNSGSSANLLTLCCLTSSELNNKALCPGDEVITVASGFPTTLNPIIQNRLIPVFVDITIPTYNVDVSQLEAALSSRTKAVVLAHTLGNPFDLNVILEFVKKHDLWLIEDCCDAVGSTYHGKSVGTFGDIATTSFYPAHHITMGEGGSVLTNSSELQRLVISFRDWGRDCWCEPGCDNTCGKRFQQKIADLPYGYDHKYIYSHIGYNLKLTDMQAAVGVAQLQKLPSFIAARKQNFNLLYEGLSDLEEYFILPKATAGSEPSWFGFPLAIRPGAPFTRFELLNELNKNKIGTRLMFGGNLLHQPAYRNIQHRTIGALPNSDFVLNNVFWLGVYPGLTSTMLNFVIQTIRRFCAKR